jgi:hypothetical protein
MSESGNEVAMAETGSGGGGVIAGIVIGGFLLVVLLFVFSERVLSPGEKSAEALVDPPVTEAPAN